MDFYTHVYSNRDGIYYRGYSNEKRVQIRNAEYAPSLFVQTDQPSPYTSISGAYQERLQFASVKEAVDFEESYDECRNRIISGMRRFNYAYIADHFPGKIEFDPNLIRSATLDIETDSSNGFSHPENPKSPIITITLKYRGTFWVLGLKPYRSARKDVKYLQYPDEPSLLAAFIKLWKRLDLDVFYGWNTDGYDIPYIVNRIKKTLGKNAANELSPWGMVRDTNTFYKGLKGAGYEIVGITSLDYLTLYRKYMPKAESEKLGNIGELELGETKVEFDGTLNDLYTKDFNKFIEYNIQDVELVERLDRKLKLSSLIFTTAYDAKCNFSDVQHQVRMWDAIIFNHLKSEKKVIPPNSNASKDEQFTGAFVATPQIGRHKWVVSFDFRSLYPSLIMEHNISHDTLVSGADDLASLLQIDGEERCQELLAGSIDTSSLKTNDISLCASGFSFRRDKRGFLPEIIGRMFEDRQTYKRLSVDAKLKLEKETDPEERKRLQEQAQKYDTFQNSKKVQLNSAYGALGNQYCRYFDLRLAESVTMSGQVAIRSCMEKISAELKRIYNYTADPIIYGDTDSLFVAAQPFVESLDKSLTKEQIVDALDQDFCKGTVERLIAEAMTEYRDLFNTFEQKLEMVRDVIAEDVIFVAKKRYIMEVLDKEGIRFQKPKRSAKGLEIVKSTTPKTCKSWLHNGIDYILKKTEPELNQLVASYRKQFEELPIDTISFPVSVSEYNKFITPTGKLAKGAPSHVTAAYAYNKILETHKLTERYRAIQGGDRIRYFLLKEANPFRTHVMGMLDTFPKEIELKQWIDFNEQFDKVFIDPLNILLKAVGWRAMGAPPSVMGIFED